MGFCSWVDCVYVCMGGLHLSMSGARVWCELDECVSGYECSMSECIHVCKDVEVLV